jgi:hypothetical protein
LHTHHLKIPKFITHKLPHNHSRNSWHTQHLPCVGPYRKTYKTSKPFLDIFGATEIQLFRFFRSSSLNKILFLINYHSQDPNPTHTYSL